MTNRLRSWFRSVFLRRQLEREMLEEMADHLARSTALLIDRGLSPEEAHREAMREFGNVAYLQEEGRIARGNLWVESIVADARFALRQFKRNRAATTTILAVLALGISINVGLFSLVLSYATASPPGVAVSDDLVRIRGTEMAAQGGDRDERRFLLEELEQYLDLEGGEFSGVAGWTIETVWLDRGPGESDRLPVSAIYVTPNYFSLLGIRPQAGAGLSPSASVGGDVDHQVVISHETWDRLYGRDPEAVGAALNVDGTSFTIVGIAPRAFTGLREGATEDYAIWLPLSVRPLGQTSASPAFRAVARLRAGVTAREATAAVKVIAARTASSACDLRLNSHSESYHCVTDSEVVPLRWANADPHFESELRLMLLTAGIVGVLALLVTCTNVSALLTGLGVARRREIAARLSLGASRPRIIRQLLTESALLTIGAAMAAIAVIWVAAKVLNAYQGFYGVPIVLAGPAAAFAFVLALGVGVVFGLSPALHATRVSIGDALKDSGTSIALVRARLQRALVVIQIAFTQPLMVGLVAMLLAFSFALRVDTPDSLADRLIPLRLRPLDSEAVEGGSEARKRLDAELRLLRERLAAVPGVTLVGTFGGRGRPPGGLTVHPDDRVAEGVQGIVRPYERIVEPGYLGLMEIPIVRGRDFGPEDLNVEGSEVPVILTADITRRLWPSNDPLGRRLRRADDASASTFIVVGVTEPRRLPAGEESVIHLPPDPTVGEPFSFLIRTDGPAQAIVPIIDAIVKEEASQVAINESRTLGEIQEEERRETRLAIGILTAGGLLTLLISAIGLYSVVRFSVQQRSGEIAVRLAVGAVGGQVRRIFLTSGLRLGMLGLFLGLPASLFGLRVLVAQDVDQNVETTHVALIVSLGILAVTAAASWLPAAGAAAMQPAAVLRRD